MFFDNLKLTFFLRLLASDGVKVIRSMSIRNISIIGLGKLGASMAAGFASRGFNVIGVDVNQKTVDAVNQGNAPVQETDLQETISKYKDRISATNSHKEAILHSDISFVIIPTPSDANGAFSLQYASYAFKSIGEALKEKDSYHVVVLTSTVLPGSTRFSLLPILEESSGKKCGKDFGLCYSPEFIALGSVIRDFLNPDFYLVGQFDERSGDMLEKVNSQTALNHAPCKRMSIENAEIAKIALNSFVTLKISYANILSELCESVSGGDVDVVTDAIGQDKRIGKHYLKGGLGFGGPCFPRDNVALSFIGKALGCDCTILEQNNLYNRNHGLRLVQKIKKFLPKSGNIAVLGLAYKPLSHVVEESQGVLITRALADAGYRVACYDPLANESARKELGDHAIVMDTVPDCLRNADAIIVINQDKCFQSLTPEYLFEYTGNKIVIVDCWRYLGEEVRNHSKIKYIPLGRSLDDESSEETLKNIWNAKE